jgi:hypothetical protein
VIVAEAEARAAQRWQKDSGEKQVAIRAGS